jgi:hypothetical protein
MSKDKQTDEIVYILNEYAEKKDYIFEQIHKLASKSVDALSHFERFFLVILVLRNDFTEYVKRNYAIDVINSKVKDAFKCHKSDAVKELRFAFDFQNSLFASYHANKTANRKKSKHFISQERFDKFLETQRTRSYTCHSYNVIDAEATVDKRDAEHLQRFKVCKAFINAIDTMSDNADIVAITANVLK